MEWEGARWVALVESLHPTDLGFLDLLCGWEALLLPGEKGSWWESLVGRHFAQGLYWVLGMQQ